MTSPADTVEEVMRLADDAANCYFAEDNGADWQKARAALRAAVEKLVAERDEAKKAAYGARLLIADVIADRDRLAAQVEELRKERERAEKLVAEMESDLATNAWASTKYPEAIDLLRKAYL